MRNTQTSAICCSCSAHAVARTAAWIAVSQVLLALRALALFSALALFTIVRGLTAGFGQVWGWMWGWMCGRAQGCERDYVRAGALRAVRLGLRASGRSSQTGQPQILQPQIRQPQMKKARRIRQASINLVAGAGFEPTTFGL